MASSKLWSRVSTLGRDSLTLSRAVAQALSPILRRQDTQSSVGDAFRNVIVSQARNQNHVATSLLTLQQQIGLIQYHGIMEYWRQRQGLLQSSSAQGNFSVAADSGGSIASSDYSSGSVAKVAFMITASMRKELSERLGYTADGIKSMTPTEASLILINDVKPEQKDEQLPGLLEAHEAELEKQREEQARLEEEKKVKEAELDAERKLKEAEQKDKEMAEVLAAKETTGGSEIFTPNPVTNLDNMLQPTKDQESTTVGAYKLEKPHVPFDELALGAAVAPESANREVVYDPSVMGSFATSMEARVDEKQEWFEVVETRDGASAPVLLFSSKEEAENTMELKRTFAERRAHEDPNNIENIPATTYHIQKTIK